MDEEIKKLLEENLELSRQTQKMIKKINNHIVLQQVFGVIKILIIVVPIILGVIYLPALLKPYWDQYQKAMGLNTSADLNLQNIKKAINGFNQPSIK
ncbi:MAG: hypothetical protein NTW06_02135 [Candidatus Falkowbacteria bacterium]|nr:hypothetical protein [Candidatus Falkowbacteria bacterium]